MPTRALRPPATLVGAVAIFGLTLSVCAQSSSSSKVTTNLKTALTGSFFLNTGDASTSEWIDVSGSVHLVVQAIPPNPIIPPTPVRVHANMAGVNGIGRTSGTHFVLNGSENFELDGELPQSLTVVGQYRFIPPSPIIPPNPVMPVNFTLQVDENGVATAAVATVGQCSVDVCDE